jgi:hypothetical protein
VPHSNAKYYPGQPFAWWIGFRAPLTRVTVR